jgi:outer membrane receptor for ferric coprogen and ferric-rhodotorulic acid
LINFQLYSTVDNIFDEQYLVGIKSFGFRLSKPRSVNVGAKYQF